MKIATKYMNAEGAPDYTSNKIKRFKVNKPSAVFCTISWVKIIHAVFINY